MSGEEGTGDTETYGPEEARRRYEGLVARWAEGELTASQAISRIGILKSMSPGFAVPTGVFDRMRRLEAGAEQYDPLDGPVIRMFRED